jgi:receptor-interacting serine/threonine-protein kinase 2
MMLQETDVLHAYPTVLEPLDGRMLDHTRLKLDLTSPVLGSGSFADTRRGTYRCRDDAFDREVAVKMFREQLRVDPGSRHRVLQEFHVGSMVRHANLVRIFGAIEVPGHGLALVMELAHGGSLRHVLSNREAHPHIAWSVRSRLLADIAQGMAKLHSILPRAVMHRDLKTANVLLSSADVRTAVAKICDFGLAKVAETARSRSTSAGIKGTFPWKAPECFREDFECTTKYTTKGDVYSFSVVIFEVVTRAWPFDGLSETALIAKLSSSFDPHSRPVLRNIERGHSIEQQRAEWLEDNPLYTRRPDLSLAEAGCPEALCALAKRCWADEPTERPEFSECLAALNAIRGCASWQDDRLILSLF